MAHAHDQTQLVSRLGFRDPDKANVRHDRAGQFLSQQVVRCALVKRFAHHPFEAVFGASEQHLECSGEVVQCNLKELQQEAIVAGGNEWSYDYKRLVYEHQYVKRNGVTREEIKAFPAISEFPLSKGDGKFKTTLGFIDVVLPYTVDHVYEGTDTWWHYRSDGSKTALPPTAADYVPPRQGSSKPFVVRESKRGVLVIEVKIAEEPIGNVLRQINFYRDHFDYAYRQHFLESVVAQGYSPSGWASSPSTWLLATPYELCQVDLATLDAAKIKWIKLGEQFEAFLENQPQERAVASFTL